MFFITVLDSIIFEIVAMRRIVARARYRLTTKLVRRVRIYRQANNKDQSKMQRKVDRLIEEINAIKVLLCFIFYTNQSYDYRRSYPMMCPSLR